MLRSPGPADRAAPLGRPDPHAALARAEAFVAAGRPDDAALAADEAERGAEAVPAPTDLLVRARIAHVRAQCHLLWGDLDAALVLHVLRLRGPAPVVGDERATAVALIDVMAQLGRYDEARHRYEDQTLGVLDAEGVDALAEAWACLALLEGHLGEAVGWAGRSLAGEHQDPEGPRTVRSHWALGSALLERGEIDEAIASLAVADRSARAAGLQHLCVRAASSLARARAHRGQADEGIAVLERARRPIHGQRLVPRLRRWIDHAEARIFLVAGDGDDARDLVDGLRADGDPDTTLVKAWCDLRTGDEDAAAERLADDLSPTASHGQRIEADLLRARCARDRAAAERALRHAVARGERDRYVTVFLEHRDEVGDELRRLRAQEPSPYLVDLVRRIEAVESPS